MALQHVSLKQRKAKDCPEKMQGNRENAGDALWKVIPS
jgi:hypothetical protein